MSRQTSLSKNSLASVLPHGRSIRITLLWLCLICAGNIRAEVYQNTDSWVAERLQLGTAPAPQILWVTPDVRVQITKILGHSPRIARYRYWQTGERTLWVLDEVGKTEDITFGFDIDRDQIQHSKVLAFRETRGWEIRAPWFTRQFDGMQLTPEMQLDRQVHAITGATLSVDAFRRSARLALYLHQQVTS